jgi:chloramphenicol-sensitive protein RarD
MNNGLVSGIFAFTFWGLVAIYWKELGRIDSYELLGHRIIWGVLSLLVFFSFKWPKEKLKSCLDTKKKRLGLFLTSILIFINWYVFVWAVGNGHVLEASIGYFINPLVNVALGVLILKEQLRKNQKLSVVLASIGLVILLSKGVGRVDISLILAFSFGTYGLIRKKIGIPSLEGLFFEMLFCLIPICIFMLYRHSLGNIVFFEISTYEKFLALLAGIVTLTPLIAFNSSVKKIPLSTIGLLQYIAPSLQFVLAVYLYNETFSRTHILSFSFIWSALLIYSFDLIHFSRKARLSRG